MKTKKLKECPKCKSKEEVIPIGYGYPGSEMVEESHKGKVRIGGCIIDDSSPEWYCKKCDMEFLT